MEGEASPTVTTEEAEYRNVFNYLSAQEYPLEVSSKDQKRNFRRKCKDNFRLEDGQLKYRKKGTQEWRVFIARKEDKDRILQSCHSCALGKFRYIEYSTTNTCTTSSLSWLCNSYHGIIHD